MALSKSNVGGKPKNNKFGGKTTWLVVAIGLMLASMAAMVIVLSTVTSTTTYYVLNQDVPARSQIQSTMLQEVTTSNGSAPPNAITPDVLLEHATYAKFNLNMGDIVTASSTGGFQGLAEGIPDNFTVASIQVAAENAVAGKLMTGNYIDIISSSEDVSSTILRNVLLLDVATTVDSIEAADDADATVDTQDKLRQGIPAIYTVAVSQADALKLASARDTSLFLTLTPIQDQVEFKSNDKLKTSIAEVLDNTATNSGEGTDPSFGALGDANAEKPAEDKASEKPASTETPAP